MIFEVLSKICIFVIFLVSTLSKGNLAKQNYDVFKECYDKKIYPELNPYLISTEISGEESLFIPTEYNVYVLARDLYKKGGKLMQGSMINFLDTISSNLFGNGLNKTIYLIKDECHQATNNLDTLSDKFFTKIINVSATPNTKRGQNPDVEISDDEAVNVKLIKRVEFGPDEDTVEDAICKFEEIKENYRNLLGVNPCWPSYMIFAAKVASIQPISAFGQAIVISAPVALEFIAT